MTGTHDDIATLLNDVVSCRPNNLRAYSKVILARAIEIADGYAEYMKWVEDIKFDETSMRDCFDDALIQENTIRDILNHIHDGLSYAVFGEETTLYYSKAHKRFCEYADGFVTPPAPRKAKPVLEIVA